MKIIFIVPYYGELPCFFPVWLSSVKRQNNVDFLLVTDLYRENCGNIRVLNWSFERLRCFIQSKFDFEISLERPYKLCDFKPAYGYIFAEYLDGYDFWGHCDVDTVFGNLWSFLESLTTKYDAIGRWGHMSLYRNNAYINRLFMSKEGLFHYQEVFSNNENYAFDETSGIKTILKNAPDVKHIFEIEGVADLSKKHRFLIGTHGFKNYSKQIFIYENGKLLQCYIENEIVRYKEIMYLHFQWKKPMPQGVLSNSFYIFDDQFIARNDGADDRVMLEKNSIYGTFFYRIYEDFVFLIGGIKKFIRSGSRQRKINNMKRSVRI